MSISIHTISIYNNITYDLYDTHYRSFAVEPR